MLLKRIQAGTQIRPSVWPLSLVWIDGHHDLDQLLELLRIGGASQGVMHRLIAPLHSARSMGSSRPGEEGAFQHRRGQGSITQSLRLKGNTAICYLFATRYQTHCSPDETPTCN